MKKKQRKPDRTAGPDRPSPLLSELLATVNSPEGHKRLAEVLENQPFPHYKPLSGRPGVFLRTKEDGEETYVRFLRGEFVPASPKIQAYKRTKNKNAFNNEQLRYGRRKYVLVEQALGRVVSANLSSVSRDEKVKAATKKKRPSTP